jgi:acetyl esterase/lipase
LTGTGIPPDHGLGVSRYLAKKGLRHSENAARKTGRPGNSAILTVFEEDVPPFPIELCVGALAEQDLARPSLHVFWLCSSTPSSPTPPSLDQSVAQAKKAILWLAGGGYVTGYPLNDRPIFSLARNLPVGKYAVLAPCISRSLCEGRSFPVPLLDALAGYYHLRRLGFKEEDIVVVGNSAGGGLTWTLLSYLVATQERGKGDMGQTGSVVMISVS